MDNDTFKKFEKYSSSMRLKQKLKNIPAFYNILLSVLNLVDYFNIRFRILFPKYVITETWRKRLALVLRSSDNARIHHVADAGKVMYDHQVMHNGLKISLASYYDYGNTVLIRDNKGVHEPQEEFVFQEVLKFIPKGGTMLELGSFWAFYSMWFANDVRDARCVMIEPDPHKMNFGKLNFKLNSLRGTFDLGFIGEHTDLNKSIPTYSVDYLLDKHKIDFIHVLHSDIQGHELQMLHGASKAFSENKVGYVFISTHANELHLKCEQFLRDHNMDIVCSANLDETFSWDGLLVGKSRAMPGPSEIVISKRT